MTERRVRTVGALVLVVGALLLTASVMAQSSSPGSSGPADALLQTLLQVDELPSDLAPGPIDEPPAFDIDQAAFEANGGQRAVGRTWTGSTGPVKAVFDMRMQFPSDAQASAYLDAAEAVLSEQEASGLDPVMFEDPIGEDARHFFGFVEANGQTILLHNYLFRVGPIAAKVFVAGVDLPTEAAPTIASAAAARMAAQGVGAIPGSSASPGASASPAAGPSTDPGVSGAPGSAEPAMAHVPPAIAGACSTMEPSGAETSIVSCRVDDHHQAIYALYVNGIAVDGDFAQITGGLPPMTAESCAEGPHLGAWTVGDEIIGQIACFIDSGQAYLVASDKRVPMIVFLIRDDADVVALHERLPELAPVR